MILEKRSFELLLRGAGETSSPFKAEKTTRIRGSVPTLRAGPALASSCWVLLASPLPSLTPGVLTAFP